MTKAIVADCADCWGDYPDRVLIEQIKSISMLGIPTLTLLHMFAKIAAGPVLEIGPYVGGSTIALASGLQSAGSGELHGIEIGGYYRGHPQLPSQDILRDLDANLQSYGVRDLVRLAVGRPDERKVIKALYERIAPRSVRFFISDNDGAVGRDFWLYEPLLADDCLLAFDDYVSETVKGPSTQRWVDRAVARGLVEDFGVYPWGTWFGRYRRPSALQKAMWLPRDMLGRTGAAHIIPIRLKMLRQQGRYYPPYDI
ncbi:MAG: class I SAM-dependent methyltransferase [Phenylobacterium sp.]